MWQQIFSTRSTPLFSFIVPFTIYTRVYQNLLFSHTSQQQTLQPLKNLIKMYAQSQDLIQCTRCQAQIFSNVWDIHRIMCDKHHSQKTKNQQSQSFIDLLKSKLGASKKKEEENGCMIPCENCGENVEFQFYELHQEECIGNQLTVCRKCAIKFPTFLMKEHNQVCVGGKKNVEVQVSEPQENKYGSEGSQQNYPQHQQQLQNLQMLISQLAIHKQKQRQSGLTQTQISNLPSFTLVKPEDCPICCTPMKRVHRNVRLMGCKHVFHRTCIGPWLGKNPLCPMCRRHALGK